MTDIMTKAALELTCNQLVDAAQVLKLAKDASPEERGELLVDARAITDQAFKSICRIQDAELGHLRAAV